MCDLGVDLVPGGGNLLEGRGERRVQGFGSPASSSGDTRSRKPRPPVGSTSTLPRSVVLADLQPYRGGAATVDLHPVPVAEPRAADLLDAWASSASESSWPSTRCRSSRFASGGTARWTPRVRRRSSRASSAARSGRCRARRRSTRPRRAGHRRRPVPARRTSGRPAASGPMPARARPPRPPGRCAGSAHRRSARRRERRPPACRRWWARPAGRPPRTHRRRADPGGPLGQPHPPAGGSRPAAAAAGRSAAAAPPRTRLPSVAPTAGSPGGWPASTSLVHQQPEMPWQVGTGDLDEPPSAGRPDSISTVEAEPASPAPSPSA